MNQNELNLRLAEGTYETQKQYCEKPDLPLTSKKMVKIMFNGCHVACLEMSAMYDDFATAEEDDSWKSWATSDEYLDMLTLR